MTMETGHRQHLQEVLDQVRTLLTKQRVVEELVSRQPMAHHDLVQGLVVKQHRSELQRRLGRLHPADIAFVLESLPPEQRLEVWRLVPAEQDGAVLLEVSDTIREDLIADMDPGEILHAAEHLDSDEIADLVPDLPKDVVSTLLAALTHKDRAEVQSALSFPEGTVGAVMDFDMVTVREDKALDVVLRYLRLLGHLPDHCNQLMVVDRAGVLKGALPLEDLLTSDPEAKVADVMLRDPALFATTDSAQEAAAAFERYGLVSAPVVNAHGQLVGRITVDSVVEQIRESADKDLLGQVGLRDDEDLFAPVWRSSRSRWAWLALNLFTAFIASRVIDAFEGSIERLVALAALMPIVASVGGNTGNQTVALVIRGLALKQIGRGNLRHLLTKELGIGVVNGLIWGSIMAGFTFLLYGQGGLALVMLTAMVLNLVLASMLGVFIPLALKALGRDPVMGSSVLLTALTDSGGFFIFLGLASVYLL